MKIDVDLLMDQGWIEISHHEPKNSTKFSNISEFKIKDDIDINIQLILNGNEVKINGDLESTIVLNCSRCLELFEYKISVPVNTQISIDKLSQDGFDIGEEAMVSILLAIPMKPLCKTTCAGICQTCGVNLNVERCKCKTKVSIDPRLEKLVGLLEKMEKKNG